MTIEEAIELMKEAHAGQTDYTGKPYWEHPVSVMNRLPAEAPHEARLAALFHDVDEDTHIKIADLRRRGVPEAALEIVELLTRRPEKGTYMQYVRGIAASGNYWATYLKRADNEENSDPARLDSIVDPVKRKQMREAAATRYARSIAILNKVLDDA